MVTPLTGYDTPLGRRPIRERAFEDNKDRVRLLRVATFSFSGSLPLIQSGGIWLSLCP